MNAGLYWSCDRWEQSVNATAAYVISDGANGVELCGGYAESSYQSGAAATTSGFKISAQSRYRLVSGGSAECEYAISIGGILIHTTVVPGWQATPTARLELDDLRVYVRIIAGIYAWEVRWSALRFYAQNSLVYSSGLAWHYGSLGLLTPASIPLIGIPPRVGATASLSLQPAEDGPAFPGLGTFEHSATAAITAGGYRWLIGSTWHAPAVTLSVEAVPAAGCALAAPSVACTATNAGTAQAWARWEQTSPTSRDWDVASSSFVPIPQYTRSVARLGPDYAALVYRGGFPQAQRTASIVCDAYTGGTATNASTELSPARSEFLANVGSAAHAIEDPFGDSIFGGYTFARTFYLSDASGLVSDSAVSGGAPSVNQPSDVLPYLTVGSGAAEANLARYVNTTCSPHWSLFLWFPPDVAEGDLQAYEWPVFGERANPSVYWLWGRQQWAYHPSLPGGENTQRRHDVMLEPMQDGQLFGYVSAVFGQDSHWWGVSRFGVDALASETNKTKTYDDPTIWSVADGSIVHGANMAVTADPGESTVVLECDLLSISGEPWCYSAFAEEFALEWAGGDIASVTVELVGWDGSVAELASEGAGPHSDSYSWPTTRPAKRYVGSWAREFGWLPFVGRDRGVDLLGDGYSLPSMLDPDRNSIYQLLPTRTAATLRFTITLSTPGASFDLEYPVLTQFTNVPQVVPETPQVADLLYPSGGGARFGAWEFPTALPVVPDASAAYRSPTVYDWFCFRNLVYEGRDPLTDMAARLAQTFDPQEGQGVNDAASGTMAVAVRNGASASMVLINGLAECPPALMCPNWERNTGLAETGTTPILKTWSYCCQRRFVVSQTETVGHFDPDGVTEITGASALLTQTGWNIRDHALAVDNDEGPTYPVMWGGEKKALASPWHGYFVSTGAETRGGDVASAADHRFGLLYDARVDGDGVWCRRYEIGGIDDEFQAVVSPDVSAAGIAVLPSGEVCIAYADDGDVSRVLSYDQGKNWSAPVAVGSGTEVAVCADERTGWLFYAYHDGSDFVCKRETSIGASLEGPWTILTGSAARIGLVVAPDSHRSLIATIEVGGTIKKYRSTNQGQSWTEV